MLISIEFENSDKLLDDLKEGYCNSFTMGLVEDFHFITLCYKGRVSNGNFLFSYRNMDNMGNDKLDFDLTGKEYQNCIIKSYEYVDDNIPFFPESVNVTNREHIINELLSFLDIDRLCLYDKDSYKTILRDFKLKLVNYDS